MIELLFHYTSTLFNPLTVEKLNLKSHLFWS